MFEQSFTGEPVSPGAAKGRLVFFHTELSLSRPGQSPVIDAEEEFVRFEDHVGFLVEELTRTIASLEEEAAHFGHYVPVARLSLE